MKAGTYAILFAIMPAALFAQVQNSDVMSKIYAYSMKDALGFERTIEDARASNDSEGTALLACLRLVREQDFHMVEIPDTGTLFPLGQPGAPDRGAIGQWASDMISTIEGSKWTNTISGQMALLSQQTGQMCQFVPGMCELFGPDLMRDLAKPYMKVCD